MAMAIYPSRKFDLSEEDLPSELPTTLKAFQEMEVEEEPEDIPPPVNPSKIMVLRMLVIMGTLGALFMVLSMAAILLGW